ncbi:RidA family protein [Arthrobacter sp. MI7-26]|uniref:RidA family protein n=1 Tax=Arthrobacter sp. MI7-26 TaxID=2993653 RepID=UPI002249266D|nr:RidA family protein [Arthrobacter sp. MI7-26]MCX2750452.1 RidA family protein [Arthrobacter sp. MI7-26]
MTMTPAYPTDLRIEDRLREFGLDLPQVAAPVGAYVPALISGDHVYTSGQLPLTNGKLAVTGKVGATVTVDEAKNQAAICAVNALAAIKAAIGSLEQITQIVKVVGFVASTPEFTQQPAVVNGASELLGEVFGPAIGAHARSAVGVAALPLDAPVEIEITVRFRK